MSSLIFVVILAVWAVYLAQHWVRRREHLATARSVDRFSEAMRVLERRRALPRPDVAERAPRSYTVSPLRPARPPLRPARPDVGVKRGGAVATAVGPTPAFRRARLLTRLRAVGLLIASLVMIATMGAAAFQLLPWWWSFIGVGALALTVYTVRWSVSRDHAQRRSVRHPKMTVGQQATTGARRQPAGRKKAEKGTRRPQTVAGTDSPLAAQAAAAVAAARTARRVVGVAAERPPTLYDVDAVEAELASARATGVPGAASRVATAPRSGPARLDVQFAVPDAVAQPAAATQGAHDQAAPQLEAAPGTWSPVPVPPPTYTLKAKAYRYQPSATLAVTPTGSAQLPVDGNEMALEEEFEELPRIDRVG